MLCIYSTYEQRSEIQIHLKISTIRFVGNTVNLLQAPFVPGSTHTHRNTRLHMYWNWQEIYKGFFFSTSACDLHSLSLCMNEQGESGEWGLVTSSDINLYNNKLSYLYELHLPQVVFKVLRLWFKWILHLESIFLDMNTSVTLNLSHWNYY